MAALHTANSRVVRPPLGSHRRLYGCFIVDRLDSHLSVVIQAYIIHSSSCKTIYRPTILVYHNNKELKE